MQDVTAADMSNGLCTAWRVRVVLQPPGDQVVVRARGEIGEVIKGVREGDARQGNESVAKQFAVCHAILPAIVSVYVRL